jgi:uncharacterized delta-60 repeat protein
MPPIDRLAMAAPLCAFVLACALWALGAVAAASAGAAPGQLDPTFGNGGTVRILEGQSQIYLIAVAVAADGRIVLAGGDGTGEMLVVRLLENGEFDPSFGNDGIVTIPYPGGSGAVDALAIQPDGDVLVGGLAKGAVNEDFLVARLDVQGDPDPGFGGGDGFAVVPVGAGRDQAQALTIGVGGRILVTGEVAITGGRAAGVAVLTANGEPDPAFSGDGVTTIETIGSQKADTGEGIVGQPDGKIVIADDSGSGSGNGFTVVRLLAGGLPDPSFSGDGIVNTKIPSDGAASPGRAVDLALYPDGRIVASGYGDDGPADALDDKFAAVRYLEDGEPDPAFGPAGTGIFSQQVAPGQEFAGSVQVTPSGQPLLGGFYSAAPNYLSAAVIRLDPFGRLDPAFASGGIYRRGVDAAGGDAFVDSALDADERLVFLSEAEEGGGVKSFGITRLLGDRDPPPAPPRGSKGPPVPAPVPAPDRAPRTRIRPIPARLAAAKLTGFAGTASDPDGDALARVQIALVRKAAGRRKAVASSLRRARSCLDLKSPTGRFKTVKPKQGSPCPRLWLTAKGTSKWAFNLKAGLPPGAYVLFARAVDSRGLAGSSFSHAVGNRLTFRLTAR